MNAEKRFLESLQRILGIDQQRAEEILEEMKLVNPGAIYGHVHVQDIAQITAHAIYRLHYDSVTLKISKHGDDETYDGHLDIEVLDIEQ